MSSDSRPNAPHHPTPIVEGEDIDLRQLVRAIWRFRWVAATLGLAGILAGLVISFMSTKHVAEGLFLTPALSLASFKKYEAAIANEHRMREFIEFRDLGGSQTEQLLTHLFDVPGAMDRAVRPAFAFTGQDAKTYDVAKTEDSGELLGIQLLVERKERTNEAPILQLAEYVRHTMIAVDLRDVMLNQCLSFQGREQELRSQQIQSDFDVAQGRKRAASLRKLIAEIPGGGGVDSRQVVSLEGGGERFLSPAAQLVAAEVAIAEAELDSEKRKRDRIAASLKKQYYCLARDVQQQPISGQEFLGKLAEVHQEVFVAQDMTVDVVEQTAIELALQQQMWVNHYLESTRFVVAPDGGERTLRKPGPVVGGVLGGVVGLGLGILLAFALAWWHDNREVVMAEGDD